MMFGSVSLSKRAASVASPQRKRRSSREIPNSRLTVASRRSHSRSVRVLGLARRPASQMHCVAVWMTWWRVAFGALIRAKKKQIDIGVREQLAASVARPAQRPRPRIRACPAARSKDRAEAHRFSSARIWMRDAPLPVRGKTVHAPQARRLPHGGVVRGERDFKRLQDSHSLQWATIFGGCLPPPRSGLAGG